MSNKLPLREFLQNPAIPRWFKVIVFFGLPFLFLGGIGAVILLVSHFTNPLSATVIVLGELPLIGAIIAFALRKIELKVFLIMFLVFGVILYLLIFIAGVVWVILSH